MSREIRKLPLVDPIKTAMCEQVEKRREQEARSKKQGARSQEPGAGSREQRR